MTTVSSLPHFIFFSTVVGIFAITVHSQCLHSQRALLLELRSELIFNSSISYSSRLVSWNINGTHDDDCCKWEGVDCDGAGRVISLELFQEGISGGLNDSSTLFRLTHLQTLDLSNNLFNGTTPIPLGIHRLVNLKHLDLSNAGFAGLIPSTISNLTQLSYLDLSSNFYLTGSIPSFHNSNQLETIRLHGNNLMGSLTNSHFEALSNLVVLTLSGNSLNGSIPHSLFDLPSLRSLHLSDNQFSGQIDHGFPINTSNNIAALDLSQNSLSGSIPHSLFAMLSLESLDLSNNQFSGQIDGLFFPINISNIASLNLSQNLLNGSIPHSLFALPSLESLDLSHNQFSGQVIDELFSNKITSLDLSHNSLYGSIPLSLFRLFSLESLDLSNNQFSGKLNRFSIANDSNMRFIDLSGNQLVGLIPADSFFQFHYLLVLTLSDNLFTGLPSRLSYNSSVEASLRKLDLSNNQIAGDIPSWVWERTNTSLTKLDLPENMFPVDIPSWVWETTRLSLNLSCNLFENHLQKPYETHTSLQTLDLHSNLLQGELPPLPKEASYVDFSDNKFSNTIPPTFFSHSDSLIFLSLANNSLSGAIPTSISRATQLEVLDLSFNKLSHDIPPHLLASMVNLLALNLRGNDINGTILDQVPVNCSLITLDLSGNNLGGGIPNSLANCKSLQVMDVGYNSFDASFPCILSSTLRVLVLRSNRFYGEMRCNKSWPSLQILDVSSNNFSGNLHPGLNFSSWRGMIREGDAHVRPNRSGSDYIYVSPENGRGLNVTVGAFTFSPRNSVSINYRFEVGLTVKGIELNLAKIWPDFTSIDLSGNNFQGDIPDAIGNLSLLYLLNLSHNALTGPIPKSFGALTELGSLDVSVNNLRGKIPEEITGLTSLSVFNVSHNELVGMIPHGRQFQTFSANFFEGNKGLCGFPLNISCSNTNTSGNGSAPPKHKDEDDEEEIEWEYVSAALGYVVGIGSIVWILIFCRSFRDIYFGKVEEVVENFFERRSRRCRRRRVERRNIELRRRV